MPATLSPCIGVCVLDPVSEICIGCGRTLGEIAAWGAMSEAERRGVAARLSERPDGAAPRDRGTSDDRTMSSMLPPRDRSSRA